MTTSLKPNSTKSEYGEVPLDVFRRIDSMDSELFYLPVAILASGFFLAVFSIIYLRGWSCFMSSHMWPTAQGVVIMSRGATTNIPFSQTQQEITIPHIEYEYVVNDVAYISAEVAMDVLGNDISRYLNAEKTLSKYRVGMPVEVRYRPSDPRDTVLEYRVTRDPDVDLAVEIMTVLAFLLTCSLWRYLTVRPRMKNMERLVQAARDRGEF